MIRRISKWLLVLFFVLAGLNHFHDPEFYYPLIPDYLPYEFLINVMAGILEIVLGIGLAIPRFRKVSSYALLILLILFVPSHVHFIQMGGCVSDGLCVAPWIAWVRLLVVHPMLILWIWYHRR